MKTNAQKIERKLDLTVKVDTLNRTFVTPAMQYNKA